jgi:hypothetical protein
MTPPLRDVEPEAAAVTASAVSVTTMMAMSWRIAALPRRDGCVSIKDTVAVGLFRELAAPTSFRTRLRRRRTRVAGTRNAVRTATPRSRHGFGTAEPDFAA